MDKYMAFKGLGEKSKGSTVGAPIFGGYRGDVTFKENKGYPGS